MALQKIRSTPVDNKTACAIRRFFKALDVAADSIQKELHDEILPKFTEKDKDGKVIDVNGPEGRGFKIDETKKEEYVKARQAFDQKDVEVKASPLNVSDLRDIRMSALELEMLGDLLLDDAQN